ncbi:MAG TPA: hypothetical protein VNX28_19750, partial [Gemmataceae bacterium]|nr:hypothetical protein [Gemmataceae bacterium]
MRKICVLALSICHVLIAAAVGAGPDDQARAVIDKAIRAQGGEASLAKLWLVRLKGTSKEPGGTTTWEQTVRLPDRMKNVQNGELDGQKASMVVVVSGNRGWTRQQLSGKGKPRELAQELPMEIVEMIKEELYASMLETLISLKEKQYQLSALPEAKVNGRLAAVVKVASKGHEDVKLYFDKENGLLVKREQSRDILMLGRIIEEVFYSDYQETDKVKLPRKVVKIADGKKSEYQIIEVQFFDKLDDRVFTNPIPKAPKDEGKPDKKPKEALRNQIQFKEIQAAPQLAKIAGPTGRYLVLVDPGKEDEFLPAAKAMAALHAAELKRFDP